MDNIVEIAGILNGTTNYILNEMTNHGSDYMTALKGAQDIGFAEKDPTDDVEALDPRRKLVLSANLAFGVSLREDDIPCFGISTISAEDITFFREHGWICKLFTRAKKVSSGVSAFVIPTLFGITAPVSALASLAFPVQGPVRVFILLAAVYWQTVWTFRRAAIHSITSLPPTPV